MVPMFVLALLATAGFANTTHAPTTAGPGPTALPAPPSAPVIRWEKFYDQNGNVLDEMPQDVVGADSLYFKQFNVTNALYGSPKTQVPNPTPASCRSGFSFRTGQTRVGMNPTATTSTKSTAPPCAATAPTTGPTPTTRFPTATVAA
jgi:hypothetical protein